MYEIGKTLIVLGVVFVFLGIISMGKIPFLGKLPGDIFIQKKSFSFYFPVTTSILISIIISFLVYFFKK